MAYGTIQMPMEAVRRATEASQGGCRASPGGCRASPGGLWAQSNSTRRSERIMALGPFGVAPAAAAHTKAGGAPWRFGMALINQSVNLLHQGIWLLELPNTNDTTLARTKGIWGFFCL